MTTVQPTPGTILRNLTANDRLRMELLLARDVLKLSLGYETLV